MRTSKASWKAWTLAITGVAAGCRPDLPRQWLRLRLRRRQGSRAAAAPVHRLLRQSTVCRCRATSPDRRKSCVNCDFALRTLPRLSCSSALALLLQPGCARPSVNHNPPMLAIGCLRGKTTRAVFHAGASINTMDRRSGQSQFRPICHRSTRPERTRVATI